MADTVQTLSLCTIHILRYVQLAVERYVMIPSREYNKKKKRKENTRFSFYKNRPPSFLYGINKSNIPSSAVQKAVQQQQQQKQKTRTTTKKMLQESTNQHFGKRLQISKVSSKSTT